MSGTFVFVAGASPQIITETVYALVRNGARGGDVFVLTTAYGRQAIVDQLLRAGGAWKRLQREYAGAKAFQFSSDHLIVLCDRERRPLDDVRTDADNEVAADQIVRFVAQHTRNGAPPLHASIAGGRKTMGYLLAAAMMLHGRREDRLSHVLVHPPALEGTDFYFLPRRPGHGHLTFHRRDGSAVRVAGGEIHVDLADLPFVRLRAVGDASAARRLSFSALVEQCQADLDALAAPRLSVLPDGSSIVCSDREVRLPDVRFALYELLAERRQGCGHPDCPGCTRCLVPVAELRGLFREQLRDRLRRRGSSGVGIGKREWAETSFRAERTKINKALRAALRSASRPYEIAAVGERGRRMYGLLLNPEHIFVGK